MHLILKMRVFAELQVRKSLEIHTLKRLILPSSVCLLVKWHFHREHCWVDALENSRFLWRGLRRCPAPLRHLFLVLSFSSLPRDRGWVPTRETVANCISCWMAPRLISNQAGCGEQWEAARPGEGDAPCSGVKRLQSWVSP